MSENTASYGLNEISEIVASMLEVVKPSDCYNFMKLLYERLRIADSKIIEFINLEKHEIQLLSPLENTKSNC